MDPCNEDTPASTMRCLIACHCFFTSSSRHEPMYRSSQARKQKKAVQVASATSFPSRETIHARSVRDSQDDFDSLGSQTILPYRTRKSETSTDCHGPKCGFLPRSELVHFKHAHVRHMTHNLDFPSRWLTSLLETFRAQLKSTLGRHSLCRNRCLPATDSLAA